MNKSGQLRIIGGQWKRRHIQFPSIRDLRPSPDATRETVFNWLMDNLLGSVCLDLYAGSGAFGFEAASRGATAVVMVDSHRQVIQSLHQTKDLLATDRVEIYQQKALSYLESPPYQTEMQKFDVVFMDPPFKDAPISEICHALIAHNRLNDDALIYIESQKSNYPLPIPSTWHIIKESQCGMVQSTLIATDIRE